jgi:hypothetical protein
VESKQKRLLAVSAVVVAGAVISVGAWYYLLAQEELPTYQRILDDAIDLDGDGYPDDFNGLAAGDRVKMRDRIVELEYFDVWGTPEYVVLYFPYANGIWEMLNDMGRAWAHVYDDVGAYAPGDRITLVGETVTETWANTTYEFIHWTVEGGMGEIVPPHIELSYTQVGGNVEVVVQSADRETKLVHYYIFLQHEGQGVDVLEPSKSSEGIFSRFIDRGKVGVIDADDTILINVSGQGVWDLVIQYAKREVATVSFTL